MSFEDLLKQRLPAVLRFAAALTGDRASAEDVVQEVLIRVHQRWDKIGRLDQPEMYIRKMIVNEFLSSRRKLWRLVPSGRGSEVDERVTSDHAARHADRDELLGELASFPGGSGPYLYCGITRNCLMRRSPRFSVARQEPCAVPPPER